MRRYIVSAFIGLLCLGFIVIVMLVFGTTTSIRCTRVEPDRVDCVVQRKLLGWLPVGTPQTVYDIRHAGTRLRADDFNDFGTWFVVLYTPDEALTFEFSHYTSAHQAQEQLATFLRDRGTTVEVRDQKGWFSALVGGFLLLATLLLSGIMVSNILTKPKRSVSSST